MNLTLVYLIGYMGSGKTTLGKGLANKLNYTFLDMDEEIIKQTSSSINMLFETLGEQEFRKIEHDFLLQTQVLQNTVISTGGGAPCFLNNMDLMNKAGTTIYIKLSVKSLVSRLLNAKTERPLIKNKSEGELQQYITEMLSKRESYYNKASFILKGEGLTAGDIAKIFFN